MRYWIFGLLIFLSFSATAENARRPAAQHWSFKTPLGTFDKKELQRGFQVYKEVCAACHGIHQLRFRELEKIGLRKDQVKSLAASYTIKGNEDEDEEERPGRPGDRLPSPFSSEKKAREANGGAYPVDLSLITKARDHGPDYLYNLLTGYEPCPQGVTLFEGRYYNPYFQGGQISMPPPLVDSIITYHDGTSVTVPQMARDVTVFLSWVAEPELENRHEMGVKVLLFLLILTGLFYGVYQALWKRVR